MSQIVEVHGETLTIGVESDEVIYKTENGGRDFYPLSVIFRKVAPAGPVGLVADMSIGWGDHPDNIASHFFVETDLGEFILRTAGPLSDPQLLAIPPGTEIRLTGAVETPCTAYVAILGFYGR